MANVEVVTDFLKRVREQSLSKLIMLLLADNEFAEDMRQAVSLDDYVQYLSEKGKRTTTETLFFLLPTAEQNTVWNTIRGKK